VTRLLALASLLAACAPDAAPPTVVDTAGPAPVARPAVTTKARGVTVTLDGALAACPARVAAALERLPDLGPLPALRIGDMPWPEPLGGGRTAGHAIVAAGIAADFCHAAELDDDGAAEPQYAPVTGVLHEVAHQWFGAAIAVRGDEAAAVGESLAIYTAWLTLPPAVAADTRDHAADRYQQIDDDVAVATRTELPVRSRRILSHTKGPLVLTAIEDHIGRERMIAALRHLVASRHQQPVSWSDVLASIEAVAGADAATWARQWIERGGAPDLRMVGARVRNGRFMATLTQVTTPPFVGEVEIEVNERESRRFRYTIGAGPVAIDVPTRELDYVILDPGSRLPRRYVHKAGPMNPELWFNAPH
jgi:hypothetical protein